MRIILQTVVIWARSTSMVRTSGNEHDSYSVLRSNAGKELGDYGEQVYVDVDAEAMKDLDGFEELRSNVVVPDAANAHDDSGEIHTKTGLYMVVPWYIYTYMGIDAVFIHSWSDDAQAEGRLLRVHCSSTLSPATPLRAPVEDAASAGQQRAPLAGRNARAMQHIDVAGSAAISPGGEVCDSQAALGVLAQIPANTMQLDTMAFIAVLSVPVNTASTIADIYAKGRV